VNGGSDSFLEGRCLAVEIEGEPTVGDDDQRRPDILHRRVYLTLNQGITDVIKAQGRRTGLNTLEVSAERMRSKIGSLREFGFIVDRGINLHTSPGRGRDYEHSTVAYKLYLKGAVPDDVTIDHDLDALLQAYATVSEKSTSQAPSSRNIKKGWTSWRYCPIRPKVGDRSSNFGGHWAQYSKRSTDLLRLKQATPTPARENSGSSSALPRSSFKFPMGNQCTI
jgi:MrcB-like, N-terminal domain